MPITNFSRRRCRCPESHVALIIAIAECFYNQNPLLLRVESQNESPKVIIPTANARLANIWRLHGHPHTKPRAILQQQTAKIQNIRTHSFIPSSTFAFGRNANFISLQNLASTGIFNCRMLCLQYCFVLLQQQRFTKLGPLWSPE